MRGKHSLFYHILIFVLAQLVWLSLLGIWIYWYVSNYIVFEKVGEEVSPQLIYDVQNAIPFILGLVLLIGLSFITSLIFRHLNVQLRITQLYDNFIANVTHELKSPLSSIQLYLETLKQRDVPPDKRKEFIDMMMKDANRLQSLINSILEISAHENKKIPHNYDVFNANYLIKELVEESCEKFRVTQYQYHSIIHSDCKILAGKEALRIIFDNLVDNAVKYSKDAAVITVSVSCNTKKVFISFRDSGVGISAKELKKIFKKFYRIANKEIPNVKGTGLGLYHVKQIVKAHNGKIHVLSEGDGKGTTFKIELPVFNDETKHRLKKYLQSEQTQAE